MRAVVTGAGGFIGANLIRHLLSAGDEPVALVRPGGDRWRLADLEADVEIVELDLCDSAAVEATVTAQAPRAIYHLAASGAYSWQQDLTTMLQVNVRATEALLQSARNTGATVVHTGSSSEYGYKDHPPGVEERVEPNSYYAVTKVAATHLCRLAATAYGVRAPTLRLYSVYGPWEEPGRLLPALVRRCLEGGWPPLVGPEVARDFVWVSDVCDALRRAAISEPTDRGAIVNICSGVQTKLGELVDLAGKSFSISAAPTWGTMPARAWDTSVWYGDPSAAMDVLAWSANTALGAGLEQLGRWFSAHPELASRYDDR